MLAENCRLEYNHHRPHSNLDYMTPAAFAAACLASAPASAEDEKVETVCFGARRIPLPWGVSAGAPSGFYSRAGRQQRSFDKESKS